MDIKATLKKFWYHEPKFDSMPETPEMGYFYESWGIHSPGYETSMSVEYTKGKIHRSSNPRLRGKWPNIKINLHAYKLGINTTINLHPRHYELEFGYAWIEDREGRRQKVHADAPKAPDPTSVWMDRQRHQERQHVEDRDWIIVVGDLPLENYMPYGPDDGIESHVPGIYMKAWQPLNSQVNDLVLQVFATESDDLLHQYRMPLTYEPRFGLDGGDVYAFDILTRDVENKLLKETWNHEKPACPVCHEPLWTEHNHEKVIIAANEEEVEQ